MLMQIKDYQRDALEVFDAWTKSLAEAWEECEKAVVALREVGVAPTAEQANFPRRAWEKLRGEGRLPLSNVQLPYVNRTIGEDDDGKPLPHVCLKVPTGGGKTLMAAATVERYFRGATNPTGLLLWIVPSRAIYQQTKASLWNREHPYRQLLERACGGRVKVLEKDESFTARDVENYLCVMLLMLPSANRQRNKDFLRMFRDSGRYPGFFPEEGDLLAEGRFQTQHPTLEREPRSNVVKHSLFNVFKICRPIVILDEAHKAYGTKIEHSHEYARAINRMDPRVVIELSATPKHEISNVLVDIGGRQLQDEEMIKLPIEVTTHTGVDDWRGTLNRAQEKLDQLAEEASELEASEGRYVRPIGLVRVKYTGKNLRNGIDVHAEDVREHLIAQGVPEDSVRVKSAEVDELGREDLLDASNRSPVRWIVTRDALKEGWDCSFAYVLVLLDNTQAKTALTQMVGRVLRMPEARSTGNSALDRCYVFCHNVDVGSAVENVRRGLEHEGLGDLRGVVTHEGKSELRDVALKRRYEFRGHRIYLPKVLHRNERGDPEWRDLDYDRDILSGVDWDAIAISDLQSGFGESARESTSYVDLKDAVVNYTDRELDIEKSLEITYFARRLSHEVPNPWRAAHLASTALSELASSGRSEEELFAQRANLAQDMRERVRSAVDEAAEAIFASKLKRGEIRFNLNADEANYKVPETLQISVPKDATFLSGSKGYIQKYLFETPYDCEFDSDLERGFARYLEERPAIRWWHRVASRQRGEYFLRGWRDRRVFPDFVAIAEKSISDDDASAYQQVLVFETKGDHLQHTDDTEYKAKLLGLLESEASDDRNTLSDAGEDFGAMTIKRGSPRGVFRIVSAGRFRQAMTGTYAEA
jgi:type III restriction enzyme